MKMIPGIVSVTFRQLPADEIIDLCVQADLGAIEWSENAHVMAGDQEGARALKKKTEDAGLRIGAYGSYYRLGSQEKFEEIFHKSLVSAKVLGAPYLRVWAGSKPSKDVSMEAFEAMAAEAYLIAELADRENIKVAFEWHKDTLTDTNESAMKLLTLADHPNLYCLWQPTVALTMEQRIKGLDLLGDRLLNLHIYYWKQGVRRPLEEGRKEWLQYLEHMDKEVCRFGLLEFVMGDTKEQFLEDAKELHRLIERAAE